MPSPVDDRLQLIQRAATEFLGGRERLLTFIVSMVNQRSDAEDLLQEVWVRLSERLIGGEEVDHIGAWCRGTARNLVLEHWRRAKRLDYLPAERMELMVDRIAQAYSVDATADGVWADRMDVLARCIALLPDKSRSVVQSRYRDGLELAQICEQFRLTHSAVKKILYRARKQLVDCTSRSIRLSSSGDDGATPWTSSPA